MVLGLRLMRAAAARYLYFVRSLRRSMYTEMYQFRSQTEAFLPSRTDRKITGKGSKDGDRGHTETERAKRHSRSSHFSAVKGRWAWAATETMSGTQSV